MLEKGNIGLYLHEYLKSRFEVALRLAGSVSEQILYACRLSELHAASGIRGLDRPFIIVTATGTSSTLLRSVRSKACVFSNVSSINHSSSLHRAYPKYVPPLERKPGLLVMGH